MPKATRFFWDLVMSPLKKKTRFFIANLNDHESERDSLGGCCNYSGQRI